MLTSLTALGIRIALDDFGTGCSSLSYLKHFPIHALKIDRNFVQGLPGERGDVAITNAIITLGTDLGLKVIAEGVETGEQLAYLQERHAMNFRVFSLRVRCRRRISITGCISGYIEVRFGNFP